MRNGRGVVYFYYTVFITVQLNVRVAQKSPTPQLDEFLSRFLPIPETASVAVAYPVRHNLKFSSPPRSPKS